MAAGRPRKRGQSRDGDAARRLLEYEVLCHQVRKDKERLVRRLQARIVARGDPVDPCFCYQGSKDREGGYPRISFTHLGDRHITIAAARAFLIMATGAPIPLGMEAGHCCPRHDRECARHVRLQDWRSNAAGCPF